MPLVIDTLLGYEDVQQLFEAAEQSGSVRAAELMEVVEAHEFDPLEVDLLYREFEQRGIEVMEERREERPAPPPPPPPARLLAIKARITMPTRPATNSLLTPRSPRPPPDPGAGCGGGTGTSAVLHVPCPAASAVSGSAFFGSASDHSSHAACRS
jgi:hypothetical protein